MKSRNKIQILIFIFLLIFAVNLFFYLPVKNDSFVKGFSAVKGTADLLKWDSDAKLLELDGEWEFYPGRLIQTDEFDKYAAEKKIAYVPNSWEFYKNPPIPSKGFATYRLKVEGLSHSHRYAFYIYEQASSFSLWINNEFTAYNGVVSSAAETSIPEWKPVLGTFQSTADGTSEFVVQISNFSYNRGGFWNPIKIGNVSEIISFREKKVNKAIFLFTIILFVSVIFFIFFLIDNMNLTALTFSIFTFCIALRIVLIEERIIKNFINLPWGFSTRLEFLAGYALLPVFALFFIRFFKIDFKNLLANTYRAFLVFAVLLSFLTPHDFYPKFFPYYKLFLVISFFYAFYALAVCIRRKVKGAYIALSGFIFIALAVIRDIIVVNHYSMVSTGVFVFVTCYSIILIQKYLHLIKQKSSLEQKVNIDALTGLYNRGFFIEYVKNKIETLRSKSVFYIMFIDLDKFKKINDEYGHDAGDEVLKCIGSRLKSIFRDEDIICRFGGDEFLIYIENKTEKVINEISDRIIQTVIKPIDFKNNCLEVGMSIGISKFPDNGNTVEELIILSDDLMYKAKKTGGCKSEMVSTDNFLDK